MRRGGRCPRARVYIIKESRGRKRGSPPPLPQTHIPQVSRNSGTRRATALRKKRLARRHYSGLNNIMSRGKRGLCNWTRERARSVGSAEETSLPLSPSVPPRDFISRRSLSPCQPHTCPPADYARPRSTVSPIWISFSLRFQTNIIGVPSGHSITRNMRGFVIIRMPVFAP